MSSFILQLLVISTFGLMVQSAPIHDVTKRSADTNLLEKSLYCITEVLDEKLNYILLSLTKDDNVHNIDNTTKTIADEAFNHFSHRCKYFTKAMTFKHRLQEHLFNNTALVVNSNHAKNLSKILTTLQLFAKIINDLELNENNSRCVELAPAQYKIMYHALHNTTNTTSLLESWKNDIRQWYLKTDLYTDGEDTTNRHSNNCNKYH